jgi:hypothetical protein
MRRLVLLLTVMVAAMMVASTGVASADPVNAPGASYGTVVCGDTTYEVVSVGNRTLTASDTNSTSQVLLILDKASGFPQRLLTECTAYPPPPDEPFTVYFLITPVR